MLFEDVPYLLVYMISTKSFEIIKTSQSEWSQEQYQHLIDDSKSSVRIRAQYDGKYEDSIIIQAGVSIEELETCRNYFGEHKKKKCWPVERMIYEFDSITRFKEPGKRLRYPPIDNYHTDNDITD